jgi:hypothetical protein
MACGWWPQPHAKLAVQADGTSCCRHGTAQQVDLRCRLVLTPCYQFRSGRAPAKVIESRLRIPHPDTLTERVQMVLRTKGRSSLPAIAYTGRDRRLTTGIAGAPARRLTQ